MNLKTKILYFITLLLISIDQASAQRNRNKQQQQQKGKKNLNGPFGKNKPKDQSNHYITGLKFFLQTETSVAVRWIPKTWHREYNITIQPGHAGIKEVLNPSRKSSVKYENLKPANNYWITILAKKPDGSYTKHTTIRVFTAPASPKNMRMVDFDTKSTTIAWDNPNAHRPTAFAIARLMKAPRKIRVQKVDNQNNMVQIKNIPPGSSFDVTIFYVFNRRRSDSVIYRVTRQPLPPKNIQVDSIRILDKGMAAAYISWEWPNYFWGSVKLSVSPPPPDGQSTYWITNRKIPMKIGHGTKPDRNLPSNMTVLPALLQGQTYTFTIQLSRGPLESTSVSVVEGIPKLTFNRELEEPEDMTCRLPMHLAPEDLLLTKSFVGQDPSLTVEWTHPTKKQPEYGYYIIVAGFSDNSKTQLFTVDADTNKFIFDGPSYDPFDEHSVTVIARQKEAQGHSNPHGSDFAIRRHTATLKKTGGGFRNEVVAPNACCGNKFYNTDQKECCGEHLYNIGDENIACCGNIIYDKTKSMCCGGGISGNARIETMKNKNPCGFAKLMVGSGKFSLKELANKAQVIRGSNAFKQSIAKYYKMHGRTGTVERPDDL